MTEIMESQTVQEGWGELLYSLPGLLNAPVVSQQLDELS